MITLTFAVFLLLLLGILFDQIVLVLVQSGKEQQMTILLLTLLNNAILFLTLIVAYFVDGYTVHDIWENGWINWRTLLPCFLAAYFPVSAAFMWRVLTRER